MANQKPQLFILAIIVIPVVIAGSFLAPTAFDLAFHRRPPERYLIPDGFTGWVRIEYRQKDAPPLPSEDGRRLIKLNAQGKIATSSEEQRGHGKDDYFYVGPRGRAPLSSAGVCKGGMIWQVQNDLDERTSTAFTRFFVGTEDQYRHEVDPMGKMLPNCA
jgi:hypothetical protein